LASSSRTELLAAVGMGIAAVLALLGVREALGLWGALGTDAPLWGLTARDVWVGARPLVPPLYPGLLAPFVAGGMSPVSVGAAVSLLSGGLLCGLVGWALRTMGASFRTAALAGALAFALPDVAGWAFQLQPDALATAWSVGLGLALWAHVSGHPKAAAVVVVLGGLAPLLRAHGLVWAAVSVLALLLGPVRSRWTALLVPVVLWGGPLLVGVRPGLHPLDFAWSDRAGGALGALTTTDPTSLSYLNELHREQRAEYAQLVVEGRRLEQLGWHAARSLRLAPDGWLLVLGGLAAAGRQAWKKKDRASLALALPLLAALPAVVIWSQRRHVVLMVPLALICMWTALRGRKLLIGLLAVILGVHGAVNWPNAARAWQSERPRAEHYADIGNWLAHHAPTGSLLGGVFQDIGLYAPAMGRHDPDGSAADWWTFYVGDRAPPARGWEVVYVGPGGMSVYQREPDRVPRPCAGQAPAEDTPHLAIARAHAEVPGCKVDQE